MTSSTLPDKTKPHEALAYIDNFTQSIKMDRIEAHNLNKAFDIVRSALTNQNKMTSVNLPKISTNDLEIDDLNISQRTVNALIYNNVKTIDDLLKLTPIDILRTPNAGRHTLNNIISELAVYGLKLSDDQ